MDNVIITDVDKLGYRSDEVSSFKKEGNDVRQIALRLKELIKENGIVSLSAPQIGIYKRIFVIKFGDELRTFINPMIERVSGMTLTEEICSSLPRKRYIRPRHTKIVVDYMTPLGKLETRQIVGKSAIVFQHQIDHLDGLLLSDVGLEIDEHWDNASEDERAEVLKAYIESLDLKQKELEKDVQENPELKEVSDAIDFMTKAKTGEIDVHTEVIQVPKEKEDNVENLDKETCE